MHTLLLAAVILAATVSHSVAETLLERGTYLVNGIVACGNCHTPQTPGGPAPGREFAGTIIADMPEFTAFAPNITPDKATGIGNWSKAELIRAIREGIRPDGSLIGPPMPFSMYRHLSDRDVEAIATYVMQVPAVSNAVPKSEYRIPLPPAYGPPVAEVPEPRPENIIDYGAYLAGPAGHCLECHTPMVAGRFDYDSQTGAGGLKFEGPWGISVASNITPHPDGRVADYSDAELATVIRTGVRPDGSRIFPPMGVHYYASINDRDMAALVAFIRTLKPKPNGG
ncbi:c-type cytochrome [Nisaea sediminum]|uniref:c-type cytochrome n=1 Tax=Nisaea sediminum TaxID=2775867 RepID=UPI001867DE71|nr:c-type cytochrome [Nisaea sediminum]